MSEDPTDSWYRGTLTPWHTGKASDLPLGHWREGSRHEVERARARALADATSGRIVQAGEPVLDEDAIGASSGY